MKPLQITLVFMTASLLLLTGCTKHYRTTKILKQDNAQVAITLNKGFETTIISTADGQRIEPTCITDKNEKEETPSIPLCDSSRNSKESGKILYETAYNVVVREGSICVLITRGVYKYEICDPPYNLGF